MAAALVGGALLSGVINVFFERLASKDVILKFFRGKKDLVKLLDELTIKLTWANVLLSDAEEKQLTTPDVKKWLEELTHVIYKADFLMDKIDTKALQRKIKDESATTTSKIRSRASRLTRRFERRVVDEGKKILGKLDILLGQKIHLGLRESAQTRPLQRLHAPLVVKESYVVGRDGDKKKIVKLLLSDDVSGQRLSVIPIVGMGGVGKTTLARLVYEDSSVRQHFDFKVWVTVSEDFNVFQITKAIFQEVTSKKCSTTELLELQDKLKEALTGKRFLFVLDDVWNENDSLWDSLKSGFQSGADGSTIIVTTRSKDIALTMSNGAMHELKLLSDEDCWHIFSKYAFDDSAEATAELNEIGLEIVARCKGLPLAVKSVAGLLRSTSNPEEWRQILNSDIWQLQFQENRIVPALWLSYHFLPPALKRCFAYCSIFPKDYEFRQGDMEKIILLWMAEGLLTPIDGERTEDVGKAYLQALKSRSFFQPSGTDKSAMVMHDLVHDSAMFISGEFCFSCGDSNDLSNLGTKSCHLSYRKDNDDLMKLGAVSQVMSLRTLLALPLSSVYVRDKPILELHELFLKVGGCLRVLSLSQSSITELPDSIGNMKYLRYLDLSRTKIKDLPDSICTLYNLQTLLLSECGGLVRLPTRLAALVNLRHLDIEDTPLKEMPPQMCKLKSLQTLSDFVLGENDSRRIKELGEFPLLGGRLRISGLEYIVDVKDVLEANLKDKEFLSELILEWGWRGKRSSQLEREVLEALQPHTNLKQLSISGYRDTLFPDWVGRESFCNMVEVDLRRCRNVCVLPPLAQLSSLRRLVIGGLDGVVRIGNEFCGSSSTTTNQPFTSLKELEISCMTSWEEWSFSSDRLGQEGGVFPFLTELSIRNCKKLIVGLPDCRLPFLKSIEIGNCDKMVGVFVHQSHQEMDPNAFPSLQSISIDGCKKLKSPNGCQYLTSLQNFTINGCQYLTSLQNFTIRGCPEELKQPQILKSLDEGNETPRKLNILSGQTSHLGLKESVPTRPRQRLHAPLVVNGSDVVGRDGDKEEIIELLLSADTCRNDLSDFVLDEGKEIPRKLNILSGQTSHLGLKESVPTRPRQRLHAPLVVNEFDVVGRDGDKKKIIELLLSADTCRNDLSVIPIVGMGGIGKTTLAQLVYNDSRVQRYFDLKVWVTVSEEFDVSQITKLIYKKVKYCECIADDVFELQTNLNDSLQAKRFLLVLDDVWNKNYGQWESLKSGFQSAGFGSTIIVTTRSKVVASTMRNMAMHELELLSVDNCWQIFAKHAFVDNQAPTEELRKIGHEIVERCNGLPLAVKSVAGLLRSTSNPEAWRQILNSDIWQLQFQEN